MNCKFRTPCGLCEIKSMAGFAFRCTEEVPVYNVKPDAVKNELIEEGIKRQCSEGRAYE